MEPIFNKKNKDIADIIKDYKSKYTIKDKIVNWGKNNRKWLIAYPMLCILMFAIISMFTNLNIGHLIGILIGATGVTTYEIINDTVSNNQKYSNNNIKSVIAELKENGINVKKKDLKKSEVERIELSYDSDSIENRLNGLTHRKRVIDVIKLSKKDTLKIIRQVADTYSRDNEEITKIKLALINEDEYNNLYNTDKKLNLILTEDEYKEIN